MTRIPIEDLVVGGMRARHFSVGIWTGKVSGVHLQHGRWVIVSEEPWSSGPPSGTAEAIRVLNDPSHQPVRRDRSGGAPVGC